MRASEIGLNVSYIEHFESSAVSFSLWPLFRPKSCCFKLLQLLLLSLVLLLPYFLSCLWQHSLFGNQSADGKNEICMRNTSSWIIKEEADLFAKINAHFRVLSRKKNKDNDSKSYVLIEKAELDIPELLNRENMAPFLKSDTKPKDFGSQLFFSAVWDEIRNRLIVLNMLPGNLNKS